MFWFIPFFVGIYALSKFAEAARLEESARRHREEAQRLREGQ